MTESPPIKTRRLNAGDLRRVARVVVKNPQLLKMPPRLPDETQSDHAARTGQDLFVQLLTVAETEIWALLADVAGMTPEELDKAHLSAPLDIISIITASDDIADFFAKALRLGAEMARVAGRK